MDLKQALIEFSSLLEVASGSLKAIIKTEGTSTEDEAAYVDEVIRIAGRLREISETISQ